MGNKKSKATNNTTVSNTYNQQEIHSTNVNNPPQKNKANTSNNITESKQQSESGVKEIEFVWYHPSFITSDTASKSKNTLYKLDLSSIDKIISHTARTNKVTWINDLTTIISNFYNPFQLPIKQSITIPKSKTINQLKLVIMQQLKQTDALSDDIYVFGWDTIDWGKSLDNTLIIKDIDERFTLLLLYHCKPHRLLNKYNIKQTTNTQNSKRKSRRYSDEEIETKLINVNVSGYGIPLKVILPYERYKIEIKNSDLRIILFDLINPYLRKNYKSCDDKDLPFTFYASLSIKMQNNQRAIPKNNNDMVSPRAFEFTLRFDGNVSDECIMPHFKAKSRHVKRKVKPNDRSEKKIKENRNVSVKVDNVNAITNNFVLNKNRNDNRNVRPMRNSNINRIEANCVMNDELNDDWNDNLNAEYSD